MELYILEKKTVHDEYGNYHLDRITTTSLEKAKEYEKDGYTLLIDN